MSELISRLNEALEGRYRLVREVGEGGMATVFLADDLRHERKVALKVLKPELSAVVGGERFLSEIKTTANLQHPNILPLFDSGRVDGLIFYVMPYVEGESLRDRLDREQQLAVEDAVKIAADLAEGLDYAHRQGVIHRDMKPANVLLLDGKPVIADFGIALAAGAAGQGRLTETGLSVGTPYYMSPEQATGDTTVGPASDTFSLGCVLYEMLVGDPPYEGSSAQAVLGKIITGEPVHARRRRPSVPLHVDAAIRKCLERLAADRFAATADLARALNDPTFRHGGDETAVSGKVNRALAITAFVLAVALVWSLVARPPEATTSGSVTTFSLAVAEGREPTTSLDLSDDGRTLVTTLLGETEGVELWIRDLDDLGLTRLPGTAPGMVPAISPDGQTIVYYAGGELRLVSARGGTPRSVTPARPTRPDWGDDGYLYFGALGGRIARIDPDGDGEPEPVTAEEAGAAHRDVFVLPGSRAILYTRVSRGSPEIWVHDLGGGESRMLTVGAKPFVTPTGHLVFGTMEGLRAMRFDARALTVTGPEVGFVEEITSTELGFPYYVLSDNGLLLYWKGGFADDEFVWVDRTGLARPVESGWSFMAGGADQGWDLSPDGSRITYRANGESGYDLWVKEIEGGPPTRLTFGGPPDWKPRWSPDGTEITFGSRPDSLGWQIWQVRADGTGEPEVITSSDVQLSLGYWAPPDGEWLVMRTRGLPNTRGGRDVTIIRPGIDSFPTPISAGPDEETGPEVSRDGRWIAYVSDETGQFEVFVRPFPDGRGGRWQVSAAGGTMPLWAHNGREMFYVDLEHRVVAVSIDTRNGFRVTGERVLFQLDASYATRLYRWTSGLWDIAPDDQRFLMVRSRDLPAEDRPQLIVVQNFLEELERLLPD
jgi:serine/threonine-protein kinase